MGFNPSISKLDAKPPFQLPLHRTRQENRVFMIAGYLPTIILEHMASTPVSTWYIDIRNPGELIARQKVGRYARLVRYHASWVNIH